MAVGLHRQVVFGHGLAGLARSVERRREFGIVAEQAVKRLSRQQRTRQADQGLSGGVHIQNAAVSANQQYAGGQKVVGSKAWGRNHALT